MAVTAFHPGLDDAPLPAQRREVGRRPRDVGDGSIVALLGDRPGGADVCLRGIEFAHPQVQLRSLAQEGRLQGGVTPDPEGLGERRLRRSQPPGCQVDGPRHVGQRDRGLVQLAAVEEAARRGRVPLLCLVLPTVTLQARSHLGTAEEQPSCDIRIVPTDLVQQLLRLSRPASSARSSVAT